MITFINVFTVHPDKQEQAMEAIQKIYTDVAKHHIGFISAQLFKSDDRSRVTVVAQWESAANIQSMRSDPKFRELHNESFYEAVVTADAHLYSHVIDV